MFFILNIRPNLKVLSKEAGHLTDVIVKTSSLAEKVSSKVRELDLAKVRNKIIDMICVLKFRK